jgi:hypothetical protein
MSSLSGKKAQDFVLWLEDAKWLLPPKMSIEEARLLFERKLKEEDELKDEKSSEFA